MLDAISPVVALDASAAVTLLQRTVNWGVEEQALALDARDGPLIEHVHFALLPRLGPFAGLMHSSHAAEGARDVFPIQLPHINILKPVGRAGSMHSHCRADRQAKERLHVKTADADWHVTVGDPVHRPRIRAFSIAASDK